jgi:hypothetical protein
MALILHRWFSFAHLLRRAQLIDDVLDLIEVGFVVGAHQGQWAHVKSSGLTDDYKEKAVANLNLPHKVLIVHHTYLEIFAFTELIELSLEVIVKLVHTSTETIEKVVISLLLEL